MVFIATEWSLLLELFYFLATKLLNDFYCLNYFVGMKLFLLIDPEMMKLVGYLYLSISIIIFKPS